MTLPDSAENLTTMLRGFMGAVRKHAAEDGPDDPVDRVLAAATLLISAGVIAWPSGRKLPRFAVAMLGLGRHIWGRRSWWLPDTITHPAATHSATTQE